MPGLKPFWFGRRCWSKTGWILFSIRRLVSLSTIGMILLLDHWFGLSPLMRRLLAKSSMISSRSNRLMTSGGILSGPAAFPSTILDFALSNSQMITIDYKWLPRLQLLFLRSPFLTLIQYQAVSRNDKALFLPSTFQDWFFAAVSTADLVWVVYSLNDNQQSEELYRTLQ